MQQKQGSYRFLDPKFKTFSRLFPQQEFIFPDSRLSNRGTTNLKKYRTNVFFLRCTGNVRARFDQKKKKIHLLSTCVTLGKKLKTFYYFPRLYLYFPDFFQVWEIAGQIWNLFQGFKTLYEPCKMIRHAEKVTTTRWVQFGDYMTVNYQDLLSAEQVLHILSLGTVKSIQTCCWDL